jgi:hypothetical protein
MRRFRLWGALGPLLALCCASGPPKFFGQPVNKPISIFVHVSKEAGETDELGGTAAIVDTLVEGFEERGFRTQLYTREDDKAPPPRIEVWVEQWDDGSRSGRGAGEGLSYLAPIGGAIVSALNRGGYVVVFRAYRENEEEPAFQERQEGSVGGSSPEASADTGRSLARELLSKTLQ